MYGPLLLRLAETGKAGVVVSSVMGCVCKSVVAVELPLTLAASWARVCASWVLRKVVAAVWVAPS